MRAVVAGLTWLLFTTVNASAQNPVQVFSPTGAATVTNWYTQNLRDPTDARVGTLFDDPVTPRGNRTAPITVGVGGLIGFGEKDNLPVLNTENSSGPARRAR